MTDVDILIQRRSQEVLEPGEHVLGFGLVMDQDTGILAFLGCGTDRRLLLFKSDYKIGWSVSAVAKAGELTAWRYPDIAMVRQHKGDHHFVRLDPHPGRGPFAHEPPNKGWRRYEIPFKVKNFDSHAKFVAEYPFWLESQFHSGALARAPGPPAAAADSWQQPQGSAQPLQPQSPAVAAQVQAAVPPQPTVGPQVGAPVLVTWSDGNRYPGTVIGVQGQHAHVHMQGGQPIWVELQHLSPAG